MIPVHKQFQFIQKIFKGNNIKFKAVMDKVNESTSAEISQEILEKYVFNSPEIDRNDPVVVEFSEMIKARF